MLLNKDYHGVFTYFGILLIIIGLLLIVTPYIVEFFMKFSKGKVHPLIYYPIYKGNGITIGISPIILLILLLVYIVFILGRGLILK